MQRWLLVAAATASTAAGAWVPEQQQRQRGGWGSARLATATAAHAGADAVTIAAPASQLVFLGTGSSTGCPLPWCAANVGSEDEQAQARCCTSWRALEGDPADNPDYRNNPSVLVRVGCADGGTTTDFVIDAGKTFRESVLRWFPRADPPVRSLEAVVLTHEHSDAMLGLDDIRGLQERASPALPVFLSEATMQRVRDAFFYMVPDEQPRHPEAERRFVASVDYNVVHPFEPFHVGRLEITPVPMIHGEDCICLGFVFGTNDRVVYLSDLSRLPPETEAFLEKEANRPGGISLLVLDCLNQDEGHNTHITLPHSLALARKLRPKRTLLVGMSCDRFPPHHEMNQRLQDQAAEIGDVQLARDGQTLCLDL